MKELCRLIVTISDLAIFNFLLLYDVASEVLPMWLTCYVRTSLICRYIGLHHFFSLFPNTEARVQYDLASGLHTIRSCVLFRYDINLRLVSVRYQSQSHIYYDT